VKGIVPRAPRQDCVEAPIWGRVPSIFCSIRVPKNTVASIILKWKNFGTTKTLPRTGRPAKLSNRGRIALVREVTKNPIVTLIALQSEKQFLWFDETKIELFGLNAKHHVWRKPGTIPTVKHSGGGIMLCGVSASGTGRLFRIEEKMNGESTEKSLMKTCSRALRT
uniref:Uncharacterized protein n=1 Tax=Oncorhynchus tshawytscha TaxID=74940 RepID=A0AAZ3SFR9_ONCTS